MAEANTDATPDEPRTMTEATSDAPPDEPRTMTEADADATPDEPQTMADANTDVTPDEPRTVAEANTGATPDEPPEPGRRLELVFAVGAVAVGAALIAAVPDLRHSVSLVLHGHFVGLRDHIRGLGAGGVALLVGLMLAHAVLFYPSEIVTATAGFAYGFMPGLGLAVGGWLASGLFAFMLGQTVGRPVLRAVFGHERFSRLERAIERGGVSFLLAGRLIPVVPFSLLGYAAGAAGVGVWRFSWTTVVGFLPLTTAVAYLGSNAKSLSLSDPVVWITAVVVVALFATARIFNLGGIAKPRD
jgi:uncharacterized membrane protein YdjX (TVP38/TMEM64 family)